MAEVKRREKSGARPDPQKTIQVIGSWRQKPVVIWEGSSAVVAAVSADFQKHLMKLSNREAIILDLMNGLRNKLEVKATVTIPPSKQAEIDTLLIEIILGCVFSALEMPKRPEEFGSLWLNFEPGTDPSEPRAPRTTLRVSRNKIPTDELLGGISDKVVGSFEVFTGSDEPTPAKNRS